jgi:hypothetical protein
VAEAGADADLHIVARDVIHKWMQQGAQNRSEPGAVGFVENEHLEALAELPEELQGLALEVMQKKIGHQHTAGWWRMLENVAAAPVDAGIEVRRPWREIAGAHPAVRKIALNFRHERAIARAEFTNPACGRTRDPSERPEHPAFVAHEEIDASKVGPRAPRGGIVVRQVVEDFGFDDTGFHGSPHSPQQDPISWKQESHQATELMMTWAGWPQTAQGGSFGSSSMCRKMAHAAGSPNAKSAEMHIRS